MRIGIDIRPLEVTHYGGVPEYIINLLPEMFKIGAGHQFVLFRNSFKKSRRNYREFLEYSNVSIKSFRFPNKFLFFTSRFVSWPKIDKLLGGVDTLFCPHFFSAPVSKNCRKIITFHDLSFVDFPEFFDFKRRIWHKLLSPKKQAKNADYIISVSNSTKQDLVNFYKLPLDKITTIYLGINKKALDAMPVEIKNLPLKYILSLCVIGPRKNLISLIYAFNILKQDSNFENLHLILAGGFERFYKRKVKKEINMSPYKDKIILSGRVSEKQKTALYKNAQVFVYPSLYEGFGLPPLEAMYCGVPTIVSHNTSLPEATGGAALLIDPYRPKILADNIKELLNDRRLYNDLLCRGRKQAEKFDWKTTAKETLNILETF